MSEALRAPHVMPYAYRRAVGGAVHRFLGGLARGEILGSRTDSGRVLVPPRDDDPETGTPTTGDVRVGDAGVIRSWTWVGDPGPEHPLDHPFAYVLVDLDGADSALLHVVDEVSEDALRAGMRVRADWRAERVGSVLDIRAFVPEPHPGSGARPGQSSDALAEIAVLSGLETRYAYEPGLTVSRFLRALGERRILGGRCPSCGRTYVPPRPRCPICSAGPMVDVELGPRGVVTAYTVVHVPTGQDGPAGPFVTAWIRLDGADVPFPHLLAQVDDDGPEVGQEVEAVWVAGAERGSSWASIDHFRPVRSTDRRADRAPA